MQHRRIDEFKSLGSAFNFLPVYDFFGFEVGKMHFETFDTFLRSQDSRTGDRLQFRQAAGMVHFRVVGNDEVDVLRINDAADSFQQFIEERLFYGINEDVLVTNNEIGVVSGSFWCAVTVEIAHIPVDCSDPIDTIYDFFTIHLCT